MVKKSMKKIQKDDEINSHDGERLLWLRESEKVCMWRWHLHLCQKDKKEQTVSRSGERELQAKGTNKASENMQNWE